MRRNTLVSPLPRTLPFARHAIWQRIPGEQRRQCLELCGQLLRAVLRHGEPTRRGADDAREDSRRTP